MTRAYRGRSTTRRPREVGQEPDGDDAGLPGPVHDAPVAPGPRGGHETEATHAYAEPPEPASHLAPTEQPRALGHTAPGDGARRRRGPLRYGRAWGGRRWMMSGDDAD